MSKKNHFFGKDYFQKLGGLPFHFSQTLRLLLKKIGVKKILDVGCGTGRLVEFLQESGFEAIGCDKSDEAVRISGQIKASATKLPFNNNSFDCAVAISLIEHLYPKETEKFLKEVRRVLVPKGYLFLVTPNSLSPMRFIEGKRWHASLDSTHVKFYFPISLKKLLKKHQFSNFQFRFRVDRQIPADWTFSLPPLSQTFQFFLNYLLISSPLAYFRDSFWILCQKRN